jgi:hypothetical protein
MAPTDTGVEAYWQTKASGEATGQARPIAGVNGRGKTYVEGDSDFDSN